VLDCAYVRPWWHTSDLAKLAYAQGLAVFLAYDKQGDKVPVIIAAGEENAFMKEFGSEGEYQEYLRGYKVRTRKLRGIVSGWDDNQQGIYRHYLRYGGAPKWVDSTSSSKDSNVAEIAPQIKKVAFDEKPMMSFSYDGRRLIEARIVDVGPDGVVLTSKDSASVTVPLERAVKMPDLQMMAREAMEAALSVGASKSVNFQR